MLTWKAKLIFRGYKSQQNTYSLKSAISTVQHYSQGRFTYPSYIGDPALEVL